MSGCNNFRRVSGRDAKALDLRQYFDDNIMKNNNSVRRNSYSDASEQLNSPVKWLRSGLVEGTSDGRMPRPWMSKWGWWVLPIALLALVLGGVWGVSHIQSQVLSAAPEMLRTAKIDSSDLEFTVDYRNVLVDGILPGGVTRADVVSVLENQTGANGADIRHATVVAIASKKNTTPERAEIPEDVTAAAIALQPPLKPVNIDVTVAIAGDQVLLDGSVPTQRHADVLQIAAASAVGAANVNNRILVKNAPAVASDPEGQINALAKALSQINPDTFVAVNLALDNNSLKGSIKTSDLPSFDRAKTAVEGSDIVVIAELPAINEIDQAAAAIDETQLLQKELGQLLSEIRRNISFDNASSQLKESSYSTLNKVVSVLRKHPNPLVEIGGHTDSRASSAYNKDLSLRRAQAVVAFLKRRGVSASRLQSIGYGETRPLAPNTTLADRRKNRRVEIVVR